MFIRKMYVLCFVTVVLKVTQNNTMKTIRATGSTFACAGSPGDKYTAIKSDLFFRVYKIRDLDHPIPIQAVMLATQKVPQKYVSTRLGLYNCKQ